LFDLYLEIDPSGEIRFRRLSLLFVPLLLQLPKILEQPSDAARGRLFPMVYGDDEEKEAEWERFGKPELFRLFASHREIVQKDLECLEAENDAEGPGRFCLAIPDGHAPAWAAALNAARLVLGADHDVTAKELEWDELPELARDRAHVIERIHLLGEIEGLLLEAMEAAEGGGGASS